MAGAQFLTLLHASSRSSMPKLTTPLLYHHIKRYGQESRGSHSRLMEERAPSTAEEFRRVAEEKAKEADKAQVGTKDGDSKADSVKERYKEHESKDDNRRRGN